MEVEVPLVSASETLQERDASEEESGDSPRAGGEARDEGNQANETPEAGEAEGSDTKRVLRKRDRREQKAIKWKQERKRRRTTRKRRPLGGLGDKEDSSHSNGEVPASSPSGKLASTQITDQVAPVGKDGSQGDGQRRPSKDDTLPGREGEVQVEMSQEEKQRKRAARKEAEIVNFQQRCNKGATVVLDLEWESELSDRELKALVQQVLYSYGSNRSALRPVRLVLSGVSSGTEMLQRLQKLAGFPNAWPGVTVVGEPYIEHFSSDADRKRLVYLTADTENVVQTIDENAVYIIGGIVDRNRLKGATRDKADAQEIATARLPLQEHIDMGSFSKVLTTNNVLEMILENQRCSDWRATFQKCLPGRKKFLDDAPPIASEDMSATTPCDGGMPGTASSSAACAADACVAGADLQT